MNDGGRGTMGCRWPRGIWGIALLGLLLAAVPAGAAPGGWKEIAPAELAARLAKDPPPVLVNTMGLLECLDHGIAGSRCIPAEEFAARIGELPPQKERPLVFYCESEAQHNSRAAAAVAVGQGYATVHVLAGGLPAWKGAGYRTVSTERIPRRAIPSLKPPVLSRRLLQGENPLLVDIRATSFFQEGHIAGAINLPMHELHRRWRELPLDRAVVLIDDRGFNSPLAASYLAAKGYAVEPLFGGMTAWKAMVAKEQKKRAGK